MPKRHFQVYRGDAKGGALKDYHPNVDEGMVVLDVLHRIQATDAPDLAVRWNCKAGKCGSCSAEVNGRPRLTCMTRMDIFEPDETIVVEPMRSFPLIRDLATDVASNFNWAKKIKPLKPKPPEKDGAWRMQQYDIDRLQEFRKCIECFLCQNVCHVLRNHAKHAEFTGPRFITRIAELEMHPLDTEDRRDDLVDEFGIGYCNITKCCSEVCPEGIHITDNAIIPLKERVVDKRYDPLAAIGRMLGFGK